MLVYHAARLSLLSYSEDSVTEFLEVRTLLDLS